MARFPYSRFLTLLVRTSWEGKKKQNEKDPQVLRSGTGHSTSCSQQLAPWAPWGFSIPTLDGAFFSDQESPLGAL